MVHQYRELVQSVRNYVSLHAGVLEVATFRVKIYVLDKSSSTVDHAGYSQICVRCFVT